MWTNCILTAPTVDVAGQRSISFNKRGKLQRQMNSPTLAHSYSLYSRVFPGTGAWIHIRTPRRSPSQELTTKKSRKSVESHDAATAV